MAYKAFGFQGMSSIYFIIAKGQWLSKKFFIIIKIQYILMYVYRILSLTSCTLFPS